MCVKYYNSKELTIYRRAIKISKKSELTNTDNVLNYEYDNKSIIDTNILMPTT